MFVLRQILCFVLPLACISTACTTRVRADDAVRFLFAEEVLADNILALHYRAAALPTSERFNFLVNRVLPLQPPSIRMAGKFVPRRLVDSEVRRQTSDREGGVLISPLFELINLAAETGRLNELQHRCEALLPETDLQHRAKAAFLILLALEQGETVVAGEHFDVLIKLVRATTPETLYDQWPETLLAWRSVDRFPNWELSAELLEYLRDHRGRPDVPNGSDVLHTHIWALAALSRLERTSSDRPITQTKFADWKQVERTRAETQGLGFPAASWIWNDAGGAHITGHENDHLYFASPLRGDFDVEADIDPHGRLQMQSAGVLLSKTWESDTIQEGTVRFGLKRRKVDPPLGKLDNWLHYRAAYRGDKCLLYLNGRLFQTLDRSQADDPWVAIRCWARSNGTFRDIRITGHPLIPAQIDLLHPQMSGWTDVFDKPYVAGLNSWDMSDGEDDTRLIISPRHPKLQGTHAERLLHYMRPMTVHGSMAYEFYYVPGSVLVHPAVDFVSFLLNPAAFDSDEELSHYSPVRIHKITDGAYDQSDNLSEQTEQPDRVTVTVLPLLPNAWNRMRIILEDGAVRLELNDSTICHHQLPANNARRPGLFHYCDQTEARVRNIVMTGSWPTTLPPLSQQEFADTDVTRLNETRPDEAFEIDFTAAGPDERFIEVIPGTSSQVFIAPGTGVTQAVNSSGVWSQSRLNPRFRMEGDFDASVQLGSLFRSDHEMNGVGLVASIADGYEIEVYRRIPASKDRRITVGWKEPVSEGKFRSSWQHIFCEADCGSFRLTRRGDQVMALFAENDSEQFQIVGSRTIPNSGKHAAELRIQTIANNGGNTVATWKSLNIDARELWHLPDANTILPALLFVMNADGTELRQLTQQIPERETQGSPDWSPDGTRIAFDTWTGQAATSDMHVINIDGTGLKSIGLGSMPTFSMTGNRLCCTSLQRGTIVMDANGTNREVLTRDGWGAQWSPNGKWIAYESQQSVNGQNCRNITLIDVATRQTQQILRGADASRYSYIYYNMEWSPDSEQICFKGAFSGGREIAIVNIADGSIRQISTMDIQPDFSWHPDGRTILMSGPLTQLGGVEVGAPYSSKGNRLYVYDVTAETLRLLPGQPMNQSSTNVAWSPDGRQIAFISRIYPTPTRWTGTAESPKVR